MGQYQTKISKSVDDDQKENDGSYNAGETEQPSRPIPNRSTTQEITSPLAPVFGSPIDNESFIASLDSAYLSEHVASDNQTPQIPLEKVPKTLEKEVQRKIPIVFRWDSGGNEVYICGSFNDWVSKIPMTNSQGDFTAIVDLIEGKHEYKFFVDGQWVHDANEPNIDNGLGSRNNTVEVEKKHFDTFFEPWEMTLSDKGGTSPPGSYTQDMPLRSATSGLPPLLPPLLQQTILNQDQPYEDPTLLPQPNHVILNHLYALSIKDNVLVLAATHRYKEKYVTILTYKPVML